MTFAHTLTKNAIQTEEGQIAALAHQAHAAQHLRAVIESKDELNKLTKMLDGFGVKHAETLAALDEQKKNLRLLEETGKQLDDRRLEIQQTHEANLAFVGQEHEKRMAEFNAHVEKKYGEISSAEESIKRRKTETETHAETVDAELVRRKAVADERDQRLQDAEHEHRQNVANHAVAVQKLEAFAKQVADRHQKVSHLETEDILKG